MKPEELFNQPRRILLIDDNPRIHEDIRKIVSTTGPDQLAEDAEYVLRTQPGQRRGLDFALTIDSANQGEEGLELVQKSLAEERPYMLAFVDVRMPPGMDGIETIKRLWQICPELQIVICTAYSDKPWQEINAHLGASANLVILKKPFDSMEVLQLIQTLTHKWIVTKIAESRLGKLEIIVEERTYQMIKASNEAKAEAEQRTEVQKAWLLAEERFQAAFDSTRTGLAILKAPALEHTEANASYLELIGHARTEVIGHTLAELKLTECFAAALAELASGRKVHNLELEIAHASGSKRQALISMVPMTIGGQKTVLLTLQDTTELRQMEAELRQVQKIDSIGQLAGGVAHDFNNILAAISLRLTLLHDGPGLDEETAQTIREIEESVARAANLTRQLLVFSRRSVPHIQVVNLETIVQGTLAMLSRLLGARIAIQFDNAAGTASAVKADPALLEQVVMNLVINARDAMAGQGTLAISLRKVELDGDYPKFHPQGRSGAFIRLSVADTGTGMDEATLGRIFEPFFTTKPAGAGTGLGLSTVFRIVKQHAGWIQVESKPGIGSTFHVYLPVPNGKPEPDEILPQPFTVAAAQQPAAALHS